MIQDIAPHCYDNQMRWDAPKPSDLVLSFTTDHRVYAKQEDGVVSFPTAEQLAVQEENLQYLVRVDEISFFLLKEGSLPERDGFSYLPGMRLRELEPRHLIFGMAAGESLYRWYSGQKFCGRCGKEMENSKTERARVCPACGNTVYPRINPAIIAAVHDGNRLVLTRYKNRPFKRYALVAGFAEIGESIEDTVRREVREETGLSVKNLRFYKSQPWVFTDTLLMGFFCELDGSDRITVEEDELAEAVWFSREDIPEDHSGISLTGEMIEVFRNGELI